MSLFAEYFPAMVVMFLAASLSAFCSSCEAAFFSLNNDLRRKMQNGNKFQRLAIKVSLKTGKILPVVLFWNLTANLIVFASSTMVVLDLQSHNRTTEAGIIAFVTLFGVIIFCEMLPKDIGVTLAQRLTPILVVPLIVLVRVLRPVIPFLEKINIFSQRLIIPNLKPEPYLQVSDLERMVNLSQKNVTLLKQEQRVLRNIVRLSDMTAEELMRPRTMLKLFKSPVTIDNLENQMPESGYLVITESNSDEIASAIQLDHYAGTPDGTQAVWDAKSSPVVYVPWLMKASAVLETLQQKQTEVAAVVNEYGETIGILTFDDLVSQIFTFMPSRSRLLLNQLSIRQMNENLWRVSRMTNIRRIERYFHTNLPEHNASTASGLIQEILERLPDVGDECEWGGFYWKVVPADEEGELEFELSLLGQRTQHGRGEKES